MAEIIRHPMIAQGALLSALVKAATWTNTDCIAEAFRAQASVSENCVIMAHHHGLLNALSRLALTRGEHEDTEKVRMAACLAIELMSRQDEARALLSQNEGIIMALTKASYGEEQQEFDHRMSKIVTGYQDASRRSSEEDRDGEVSDDDMSLQSRRIQLALKNLVAAM
jgi:RecA-family ATPase